MISQWVKQSLSVVPEGTAAGVGRLVLRLAVGLMIFPIHGWHKLEGGLAYLQHGTPWKLAEEVAAMHFPFPVVSAFVATILQFVCAPLLAVGFATRLNLRVNNSPSTKPGAGTCHVPRACHAVLAKKDWSMRRAKASQ